MKAIATSLMLAVVLALGTAQAEHVVKVTPGDAIVAKVAEVRVARKAGRIAAGEPVTFLFAPGVYRVRETLELMPDDSGASAKAPVKFRAEKSGTVFIRGGETIPASAWHAVSDPAMRARFKKDALERILEADVSSSMPGSTEKWPDWFNGMVPGPWLYCGGEPLALARWPDADAPDGGWAYITRKNILKCGSYQVSKTFKTEKVHVPGAFTLPGCPAARWDMSAGVWLSGYFHHDWYHEHVRIGSFGTVDGTNGVITLAAPTGWGIMDTTWGLKGRRVYAINVAEELDRPGEWYLDRKTKRIYVFPPEGFASSEYVLAGNTPAFVKLSEGVRHVRFENLDFEYSHGTTVLVMKGDDNAVTGCTFRNHAGYGLAVNGKRNLCLDCTFRNFGAGVVNIYGGDRRWLLNGGNLLDRADISRYGIFKRTFCQAVTIDGCGNAMRGCRIHDGPYVALSYGGNEHLIAENEFVHVVQEAADSGAIYTGHDASSQGNVIFGNNIHHLGKADGGANFRNGIYFDDCDWGDAVIGNRFEQSGRAIFIGGGNMHPVRNNLIIDCLYALHVDSRGVTWQKKGSFATDADGYPWAHTKCKPFNYRFSPWLAAYPQLADIIDDRPELPHVNEIAGNVCVGCKNTCSLDGLVMAVTNEMPIGANIVLTDKAEVAKWTRPPQPVQLRDAVRNRVVSTNGDTQVAVFLDVAGRLSFAVRSGGRMLVDISPLGITVGCRDYGKMVVPGKADETNPGLMSVPLQDLVTRNTVAWLDVEARDRGAAFRWRVPGEGARKVYGEMTAFLPGGNFIISEEKVPKGWPKFHVLPRGKATGIVYPQAIRGFMWQDEIISPWRVVSN